MKKLLFLTFLFVAQFGFGQGGIIIKQSNATNFYNNVYLGTDGSTPSDTAEYAAKFLRNKRVYLKPNTPVVGYVFTALDTNGRGNWQAAGGSGDYSPWDTTATAIVQKDTTLSVGIGTASPAAKLHVDGNVLIQLNDTTKENDINFYNAESQTRRNIIQNNDTFDLHYERGVGGTFIADITLGKNIHLNTNGNIILQDGSAFGNGDVGIGTATPARKLHVNGNTQIDSSLVLKGVYITSTDSTFTIPDNISSVIADKGSVFISGTLTFPANPLDGQILSIYGNYTAVTLDGNGKTIGGTAITALLGVAVRYRYEASVTTWFPW